MTENEIEVNLNFHSPLEQILISQARPGQLKPYLLERIGEEINEVTTWYEQTPGVKKRAVDIATRLLLLKHPGDLDAAFSDIFEITSLWSAVRRGLCLNLGFIAFQQGNDAVYQRAIQAFEFAEDKKALSLLSRAEKGENRPPLSGKISPRFSLEKAWEINDSLKRWDQLISIFESLPETDTPVDAMSQLSELAFHETKGKYSKILNEGDLVQLQAVGVTDYALIKILLEADKRRILPFLGRCSPAGEYKLLGFLKGDYSEMLITQALTNFIGKPGELDSALVDGLAASFEYLPVSKQFGFEPRFEGLLKTVIELLLPPVELWPGKEEEIKQMMSKVGAEIGVLLGLVYSYSSEDRLASFTDLVDVRWQNLSQFAVDLGQKGTRDQGIYIKFIRKIDRKLAGYIVGRYGFDKEKIWQFIEV